MGGPVYIVIDADADQRVRGPACTDNFQYIPFTYNGREWHSVEQAFQAAKFGSSGVADIIRLTLKKSPDETDSSHGMQCWQVGQGHRGSMRSDWDKVKVQIMYDCCMAKYAAHEHLREQLLDVTGNKDLEGGPSTHWRHPKLGPQEWGYWNGLIQMRCREMIKPAEKRNAEVLSHLEEQFRKYAEGW